MLKTEPHKNNKNTMVSAFLNSEEKTHLWTYLHFTGISVRSRKTPKTCLRHIFRFWYPLFLHIALLPATAILIVAYRFDSWRIDVVLSSGIVNVLSVVLWHMTYYKSRALSKLVAKIKGLYLSQANCWIGNFEAKCTNMVLLMHVLTPSVLALLYVFVYTVGNTDNMWTYGYKFDGFPVIFKILLFANINIYESIQIIFPGILTCAYCTLCHRLSKLLINHNKKLLKIRYDSQYMSSSHFVKEYFLILNAIELLQKTFSEPIFLLFMKQFLHLFSLLACTVSFSIDQFTAGLVIESIIVTSTNGLSSILIIIYASRITSNMKVVKHTYRRYKEKIILHSQSKVDAILQLAIDREIIELSAFDVVFFKKSLILSLSGVILTYSLLIFQIVN
ncbi:uncharacterized protein NPIL_212681 [Nephila pilipes]|uniref:Uncharacterized protein n=1 Tax=Nephila pilipes TaxID=299642 RepID=A0A8X6TWV5_NEPPI|nr:uncharacterized protein NPIL_212681 [Nephila pilipes]